MTLDVINHIGYDVARIDMVGSIISMIVVMPMYVMNHIGYDVARIDMVGSIIPRITSHRKYALYKASQSPSQRSRGHAQDGLGPVPLWQNIQNINIQSQRPRRRTRE